jgi:hypothetical protein
VKYLQRAIWFSFIMVLFLPPAWADSLWSRYVDMYDRAIDRALELDLYGVTAQLPQGFFSYKADWNHRRAAGRFDKHGNKVDLVQPIVFGEADSPDLLLDLGASGAGQGLTLQFSYGITDPLDFYIEIPLISADVHVRPKLRRMSTTVAMLLAASLPAGYAPMDLNWFENGVTKEQYLNAASAWILDYLPRLGRPSLEQGAGYPEDLGPGKAYHSDGWVLADINLGCSWNFFRSHRWSGAFTGRVYFPTGNVPDPNNSLPLGTGAEIGQGQGSFGIGFTQGYDVRVYQYKYWLDILLSAEFTAAYYFEHQRRYPDFPRPTSDGQTVLDLLDPNREIFPDMSDLTGKSYGYSPGFGASAFLMLGISSLIFDVGIGLGYFYSQEPTLDADERFAMMVSNLEMQLAGEYQKFRASAGVTLIPFYIPLQIHYQHERDIGGRNMIYFDQNHWIKIKGFFPKAY